VAKTKRKAKKVTEEELKEIIMKKAQIDDEEEDEKEAKKLGYSSYEDLCDEDLFDWDLIIEDIKGRIEVV